MAANRCELVPDSGTNVQQFGIAHARSACRRSPATQPHAPTPYDDSAADALVLVEAVIEAGFFESELESELDESELDESELDESELFFLASADSLSSRARFFEP
jgi:hypothetical protein